jgi:hypothetical protein
MPSPVEDHNSKHVADASAGALSALKRFARTRPQIERCELCSAELYPVHRHLLDRKTRQIACACNACSILFCEQQDGKYLRVPRDIRQLNDFAFSDLQWESMTLPINLSFFFRDADGRMIAMYPSPAGAIESLIDLTQWEQQIAGHPRLTGMKPEVEALIVNRVGEEHLYFIAPIDECYRLTGVIRTKWRGLSGGIDVWASVAEFFQDLKRKAGTSTEMQHA